jgi:modification target Cys-rich repeat protein
MRRCLLLIALTGFSAASALALTPMWINPALLRASAKVTANDTATVAVEKCVCGDRSADGKNCICRGTSGCADKCGGDCGNCPGRGDGCQGPCKDKCAGPCKDKCQGACQGKCGGPCGDKAAKREGCPNRQSGCKRAA